MNTPNESFVIGDELSVAAARALIEESERTEMHSIMLSPTAARRVGQLALMGHDRLRNLKIAEEQARLQDRVGNEGDADAIRRSAIRAALGETPF